MRARLLLAAAVACLAFSAPARGQAPKRVLVIEPLPKGAAERIAGQVADLPWTLQIVSPARRTPAVDTATAEGLGREPGVGAVLWVEEDSGGFTLHLYDPKKHQVMERQLPRAAGASPLARSAALEALALAVRSGLSALSADANADTSGASGGSAPVANGAGGSGNTGTTQSTVSEKPSASTDASTEQHTTTKPPERQRVKQPEPDSEPDSEPEPEPDSDSDSDADAEPEPDSDADSDADSDEATKPHDAANSRSPALILSAGWATALDGQSPIQHGPSARLGIAFDRLELALEGQLALPADVEDQEIRIQLQRSVALASASLELVQTGSARLAISAGAGVASFARDTQRVETGLRATGANDMQTFAAQVELRGRVRLVSIATVALDLELGAGVLVLPAAPTLRYEGATGRVEHALWVVQPQLRLGPCLRISL